MTPDRPVVQAEREAAKALDVKCPWCGAKRGEACINQRDTRLRIKHPHPDRIKRLAESDAHLEILEMLDDDDPAPASPGGEEGRCRCGKRRGHQPTMDCPNPPAGGEEREAREAIAKFLAGRESITGEVEHNRLLTELRHLAYALAAPSTEERKTDA